MKILIITGSVQIFSSHLTKDLTFLFCGCVFHFYIQLHTFLKFCLFHILFMITSYQSVFALPHSDNYNYGFFLCLAFLFLVALDPNPEVRKTVISCIAPCLKTLPAILKRTRDAKDTVRQVAFTVIAEKIPLKALTIGQRVQLLQEGLNDRAGA